MPNLKMVVPSGGTFHMQIKSGGTKWREFLKPQRKVVGGCGVIMIYHLESWLRRGEFKNST